jgi:hypothetical protein
MSWVANMADLDAALIDESSFGERFTLADGSICLGVFDPVGVSAEGHMGSEVGLLGRISAQRNPIAWLRDPDVENAGLVMGAELTIRGLAYTVVKLDPDGEGMTQCSLMPSAAASADTTARYR